MQRFLKWLGLKVFPQKPDRKLRHSGIRPKPKPSIKPQMKPRPAGTGRAANDLVFNSELHGHVEDGGSGKNVLVRSKYIREDTGTHETLKIIDNSIADSGEESGFDPYNTGKFDRSRNWNSRTGK